MSLLNLCWCIKILNKLKIGILETTLCKNRKLGFSVDNLFIYKNNGEQLVNFYFHEENIY